jgi:hypothetical protein
MQLFTRQMLSVAYAYCAASGLPLSTASRRAFGESKLLAGLETGMSSPTFKRAEQALVWFSTNWPEGAAWPDNVPRPSIAPLLPAPEDVS